MADPPSADPVASARRRADADARADRDAHADALPSDGATTEPAPALARPTAPEAAPRRHVPLGVLEQLLADALDAEPVSADVEVSR